MLVQISLLLVASYEGSRPEQPQEMDPRYYVPVQDGKIMNFLMWQGSRLAINIHAAGVFASENKFSLQNTTTYNMYCTSAKYERKAMDWTVFPKPISSAKIPLMPWEVYRIAHQHYGRVNTNLNCLGFMLGFLETWGWLYERWIALSTR